MNTARLTNTQPTYDFLAGTSSTPVPAAGNSLRQSLHLSQPVKPGELAYECFIISMKLIESHLTDSGNEELRVQVNTLRYELENIEQERDLAALRHEKEVRDLQARADADFRKAQVNTMDCSGYY